MIPSERAALALAAAGAVDEVVVVEEFDDEESDDEEGDDDEGDEEEGLRELEERAEVPEDTEVGEVAEVETYGFEVLMTQVGRRDEPGTEVVLLLEVEVELGRLDETWTGPGP